MTHRPCFSCFLPQQRCHTHTHTVTCHPNGHGQTVAGVARRSRLARTLRTCMRVKIPCFNWKRNKTKREQNFTMQFGAREPAVFVSCTDYAQERKRKKRTGEKDVVRQRKRRMCGWERERSQCLHVCRFPALSVSCQTVIYGCETHSSPCCQFSIVTTDI